MTETILSRINERRAVVGVIGLGYVGLPLAVEFGRGGLKVIGFDLDASRVNTINSGRSYIPDVATGMVKELVDRQKFSATTDFSLLATADAVIICVPTPLRKTKEPDISYILAAAEQVKTYLHSPQLVVLESTTYPGNTDEILVPMLEETGLILDKDFYVAFSPERVDPGNKDFQTHNIPKVVGGPSRGDREAPREHFSLGQHRSGKRNGATLLPPRDRFLGGNRGGGDQTVRVYGLLSRTGHRWPLHTA
jgi:UDP-N-acetyl-D-glucosamine dehydrogenase